MPFLRALDTGDLEVGDVLSHRMTIFPRSAEGLERYFSALIVSDSNCLIDLRNKDLSIADGSSTRGADDGIDCALDHIVCDDHLELYFGEQVYRVFASAIYLGMSFLTA